MATAKQLAAYSTPAAAPPPPGQLARVHLDDARRHPSARDMRALLAAVPPHAQPTLRHLLSCRHCLWRLLLAADDEDQGHPGHAAGGPASRPPRRAHPRSSNRAAPPARPRP